MRKNIKKQRDDECPVLEVRINGLPDLSLMASDELNMLAYGLDRTIDELARQETADAVNSD